MSYTVIGVERVSFTPAGAVDNITGVAMYLARDITAEKGTGTRVERHFFSTAKLVRLGLDPDTLIGQTVQPYYNRFGKIEQLEVVD